MSEKQTEEDEKLKEIQERLELLAELVMTYASGERQERIMDMFDEIGVFFVSAPASSRKEYHNAFFGGLFDHSLNVWANLKKANKAFNLGFSDETMFTVSLLHDIGKCVDSSLKEPNYVSAPKWQQEKNGKMYEFNTSSGGYYTNRDRTMFILQYFNIKLSHEEYQAILLNDGPNMEANRAYSMKECDLAFWVQVADNWAARLEKGAEKKG